MNSLSQLVRKMPAASFSSTRQAEQGDDTHGDDDGVSNETRPEFKEEERSSRLSESSSQALLANWETIGYAAFQLAKALGGYFSDKIVDFSCTLWQEISSNDKITSSAQQLATVCFDAIEKEMKEEHQSQRTDSGGGKAKAIGSADSTEKKSVKW